MSKLSFSFKKKVEKPVLPVNNSQLVSKDDLEDKRDDRDFIVAINEKSIETTKVKETKTELVIPCIRINRWAKKSNASEAIIDSNTKTATDDQETKSSLDQMAERALLNEIKEGANGDSTGPANQAVIPLLARNRVPHGFEEDNNFDVSLRPVEPTKADYDVVPVEHFGLAMLRGMGLEPGDSKKVKPLEVKIRPKGMGLGADVPLARQQKQMAPQLCSASSKRRRYVPGQDDELDDAEEDRRREARRQQEEEVDDEIRSGSLVQVQAGKHRSMYGQVEAIGDDLSTCIVRLTLKNKSENIAISLLRPVCRKEYDKNSKVLNTAKVDEYYREKRAKGEVVY